MPASKLERKAKQTNWNSPLEQSRVQSRGMSSRGGVFRERRSVQVVCQNAEERKHPTVRGERNGGEKPRNCESTALRVGVRKQAEIGVEERTTSPR